MRNARTLVAVVWMVLFFGGLASAQEDSLIGTITRRNNSVAKVMRAAGCNRRWMSQVIADSAINPARLQKLRIGQKLYLRGGSCKDSAPTVVAGLSEVILHSYANQAAMQRLQAELTSLRNSAAASARRLESSTLEAGNLKSEVVNLERELKKTKQAVEEANARVRQGTNPYVASGVGLAGLLSGMVLMYGVTLWLGRNKVSFLKTRKIESAGKHYVYSLFSASEKVLGSGRFVGWYKCPLPFCSENHILGVHLNLKRHIEEGHPGQRVTTDVDPSLQGPSDTITRRVRV